MAHEDAMPNGVVPFAGAGLSPRVVGVSDGDTITVLDSYNQQHRIRLYGIDAPEKKQPFGNRAKQNLSSLAFGGSTVEWSKLDRYGRIVGKVTVSGEDVGLRQLQAGLAWWYRQYAREQRPQDRATYAQAEDAARRLGWAFGAIPKRCHRGSTGIQGLGWRGQISRLITPPFPY